MIPNTFIAITTLWGHGYDEALRAAIEEYEQKYKQKPSVVLLNPGAPEIEVSEGMKVIRKRNIPLGEVWVG